MKSGLNNYDELLIILIIMLNNYEIMRPRFPGRIDKYRKKIKKKVKKN